MSTNSILQRIDSETRDVIAYLKSRDEVCDLYIDEIEGASKIQISEWEIKNMCSIPADLKSFYMNHNGLLIEWKCKLDKGTVLPLGKIQVNGLKDLTRVGSVLSKDFIEPSVFDLEDIQPNHVEADERKRAATKSVSGVDDSDESSNFSTSDSEDLTHETTGSIKRPPRFDSTSRNFELYNCNGYGKICLVYADCQPGQAHTDAAASAQIWYLDRSLTWHFLASSFTNYYRLLIAHLGLPQWPMLFTPDGLPPCLLQWFYMFTPGRVLVQQDYWKDSDNLRVAESVVTAVTNTNTNTTSATSNTKTNSITTNSRSNPNNKKPNTVQSAAANMTPNNDSASSHSTNKIDFSLFEEKQPKIASKNTQAVASSSDRSSSNTNNYPKGRSSSNKK